MINRKKLLHWCGGFYFGNILLLWLLGLMYLPTIFPGEFFAFTPKGHISAAVFIISSYLMHFSLLALLPCVIVIPLIVFFPYRHFLVIVAITLSSIIAFLLVIDVVIYGMYRFHLSGVVINIALNGFELTWVEWLFGWLVFCGIVFLEWILAYKLTRFFLQTKIQIGKLLLVMMLGCAYLTGAAIALNLNNSGSRLLFDSVRFLPFYNNVLATIFRFGNIDRLEETKFVHPPQASAHLNYPLRQDLQCNKVSSPLSLLIIVIDAWRFDMLKESVTPYVDRYAKKSWLFQQHYSGGNATGPGVFSLFYGLPATYWTAMQAQHQGPVLIEELIKQQYRMGIFASAPLHWPALDTTVFLSIKNLQLVTPGNTPYERDRKITEEFSNFLTQFNSNSQPFFGYLFYDTAHGYCSVPETLNHFQPIIKVCKHFELNNSSDPVPYLNRYKNALILIDQQVKQVMSVLKAHRLQDKTIVIITGDHGEEFNDNQLGYWGHASNFTHYQTQVPLIVYWPGKKPTVFTHKTSHYDIVPTLMNQMLGCHSSPNNYSVGTNLLDKSGRTYLAIGSYIDFGILESDRITRIYPLGNFEIDALSGKTLLNAKLNVNVMTSAFVDMRKFFKV